jgi:hypothetical protein
VGLTPQCFWEFLALEQVATRFLEWLDSEQFGKRHLAFIIVGLQNNCHELAHHEEVAPAVCTLLELLREYQKLGTITEEARDGLRVVAGSFKQRLENLAFLKERWVPELATVVPTPP